MRKLMSMLLVTAVAVVGMAATGASASAAVWQKNGEPLSESVEFSLHGGEVIQVSAGAFLCNADATMTTAGGSTAQITAYSIELGSCEGLLGEFDGCEVTAATPENLPWAVTVNSEDLTVQEVAISYSFDETCPVQTVESSFPEAGVTLEEPSAIRNFRLGQEGTGKVDGEEGWLTDSDILQLPEEEFGIYGIG